MTHVRKLKVGESLCAETFLEFLPTIHYRRTDFVTRPGEFSVRGGIFDVYPVTYKAPIRIEIERDTISSIRDFSPADGKSLASFDELFLIPVSQAFERRLELSRKRYESFDPLTEIRDLRPGDIVVHIKYGIGRYLGGKTLQTHGVKKRHLAIEYADREIIYLDPKEPLDRYIGGGGKAPKLTKLHGKEWERIKDKTRRIVSDIAAELIEIQAKREIRKGISFPKDHPWQKQFEAEFPFEDTPDQKSASEDVKKDMESEKPMDRLIAGDVGYGKTEVAMRAAFKAVTGGYQAAVLVPTTVLAEQHYLVFKQRMKSFPLTVEVLSRFRSKKEQSGIVQAAKNGTVDILIGTHRLLSKDIQFKNLGLMIIDEEQRFGVRHKEKLKQMREVLDVLTLTATPIPRTLYLSLVGVRDMSVINTPPKNRLPIETAVLEYDDHRVREAFEREMMRGGQLYFVHNRVQSIEKMHEHLKKLMPHVKFSVAHGQISAQELEAAMEEFVQKKTDCLIASSIIESGIDIPNVNTIIVNRADRFGLSDLYQLRGRVGRFSSQRQAYAYFMVPPNWVLSQNAEKRLDAIERFTELGSGFKIALEDLEIRGAGNLLGREQSGFIHAVGFDLYCRMLEKAIRELGRKP